MSLTPHIEVPGQHAADVYRDRSKSHLQPLGFRSARSYHDDGVDTECDVCNPGRGIIAVSRKRSWARSCSRIAPCWIPEQPNCSLTTMCWCRMTTSWRCPIVPSPLVVDGDPTEDLRLFQDQGAHLPVVMKAGKFAVNLLGH